MCLVIFHILLLIEFRMRFLIDCGSYCGSLVEDVVVPNRACLEMCDFVKTNAVPKDIYVFGDWGLANRCTNRVGIASGIDVYILSNFRWMLGPCLGNLLD